MKNQTHIHWTQVAKILASNSNLSWRMIAREIGVAKSTCSDYLRKQLS